MHLSVVEIYCESIKDLLSDGPGSTGLAVQQDKELGIVIAGATKVHALSLAECCVHLKPEFCSPDAAYSRADRM